MPVANISANVVTNCFFLPGTVQIPQNNSVGSAIAFPCTQETIGINPTELFMANLPSGITSGVSYCPKSIWMGPSDSLIFRGSVSGGSNQSVTVVWNFTAITES